MQGCRAAGQVQVLPARTVGCVTKPATWGGQEPSPVLHPCPLPMRNVPTRASPLRACKVSTNRPQLGTGADRPQQRQGDQGPSHACPGFPPRPVLDQPSPQRSCLPFSPPGRLCSAQGSAGRLHLTTCPRPEHLRRTSPEAPIPSPSPPPPRAHLQVESGLLPPAGGVRQADVGVSAASPMCPVPGTQRQVWVWEKPSVYWGPGAERQLCVERGCAGHCHPIAGCLSKSSPCSLLSPTPSPAAAGVGWADVRPSGKVMGPQPGRCCRPWALGSACPSSKPQCPLVASPGPARVKPAWAA